MDSQIKLASGIAVAGALAGVLGAAVGAGMGDSGGGQGGWGVAHGASGAAGNMANSPQYSAAQQREAQAAAAVNEAMLSAVGALSAMDPALGTEFSKQMVNQGPKAFENLRTTVLPALRAEIDQYPVSK